VCFSSNNKEPNENLELWDGKQEDEWTGQVIARPGLKQGTNASTANPADDCIFPSVCILPRAEI
jgi:hypothetical protein